MYLHPDPPALPQGVVPTMTAIASGAFAQIWAEVVVDSRWWVPIAAAAIGGTLACIPAVIKWHGDSERRELRDLLERERKAHHETRERLAELAAKGGGF